VGEFSWGYCSCFIRVLAWPVCTCTWLLSVLFGMLLENDLNSLVVSWGLVHCLQKRSHPLWDFLWHRPEDIGRQQENILLSTGSLSKWSGCYWLWNLATCLPGFHVLWVIIIEAESPPRVTFLEPLPQKRTPKMTPRLLTDTLPHHHMHTWTHINTACPSPQFSASAGSS
jgi:hypothetical protein